MYSYSLDSDTRSTTQAIATPGEKILSWGTLAFGNSTNDISISFPPATVADMGREITIKNQGTGIVTPVPATDNILNGSRPLKPGESIRFVVSAVGVADAVGGISDDDGEIAPELLPVWEPQTAVLTYAERQVTVGGTRVSIISTSSRTTGSTFDLQEAAHWSFDRQSQTGVFPASSVVFAGFKIQAGTEIYQAAATRTTGLVFDSTENVPANWTLISSNTKSPDPILVGRPDADNELKTTRITLLKDGDSLSFPPGDTTAILKAILPSGTGKVTISGKDYALTGDTQELQWAWDGTDWKDIGTKTTTVSHSESVILASLPADSWTDIPAGQEITSPRDIEVFSSTKQKLRLPTRLLNGKWQIGSSIAMTNLQIILLA